MDTTITITQQWQIYIPEKVRELLDLVNPVKARLEVKDKSMVITPQPSAILSLAGKYRTLSAKKRINLDRIRDRIDYSQL